MLRLARKALLLFGIYTTLLAAVVVAGFLGRAVGMWASILWGAGIIIGVALTVRRRNQNHRAALPADRTDGATR